MLGTLVIAFLLVDLVWLGRAFDLGKSDWAAWVQAIGSIAAIFGAFIIANGQLKRDREADQRRRQDETDARVSLGLQARARAVKNMVEITTRSLNTASALVTLTENRLPQWEVAPYLLQIGQLQSVVGSMITPDTEPPAVVAALELLETLTQVAALIQNPDASTSEQLLRRTRTRIIEANYYLGTLTALQNKLDTACRERGLPLDTKDFRPRG